MADKVLFLDCLEMSLGEERGEEPFELLSESFDFGEPDGFALSIGDRSFSLTAVPKERQRKGKG
jgi:hypothetical protein